jgi:hypothetical protein
MFSFIMIIIITYKDLIIEQAPVCLVLLSSLLRESLRESNGEKLTFLLTF